MKPGISAPKEISYSQMRELARKCLECRDKQQGKPGRRHDPHPSPNAMVRLSATTDSAAGVRLL